MPNTFNGFTHETLDFLFELKFNNTIDKLVENKIRYKKLIMDPLTSLYSDVLPVIKSIGNNFDTKAVRCISSMYTDRRFSIQPPLKEYMYLRFKVQDSDTDILGFYFDMGLDYYSFGLRIYKQTNDGMTILRDIILKSPGRFDELLSNVKQCGFSIIGEKYKRDNYPDMEHSFVKDLLNHKNFYIGRDKPVSEIIFSKSLLDEICHGFLQLKEVFALLNGIK